MITKVKRVVYSLMAMGMIAPVSVFAYDPPANTNLPGGTLTGIISNIMTWMLGIVGFLGVIGFAISGVLYLTAAGDEDRIATAKRAMTWSIVGVIVALLGVVIIKAANSMLGGENSDF